MMNSKDFKDLEDCIDSSRNPENYPEHYITENINRIQNGESFDNQNLKEEHIHTFLDDYESNEVSEQDYMELLSTKFTADILDDNKFNIFIANVVDDTIGDIVLSESDKEQSA